MSEIPNKSAMYIDYQPQDGNIEFTMNRMDLTDMQLLHEALMLLIDKDYNADPCKYNPSIEPENKEVRVRRLLQFKKEFEVNHFTQNTQKSLIEKK